MARPFRDFTNKKIGRLTYHARVGTKGSSILWSATCDCGVETTISSAAVGRTKSCGCLRREGSQTTHGHARYKNRSRSYNIWNGMKSRCLYPSQPHYERYGGRGIKVCERWMTFDNFLADMGEPPTEFHTLERSDNNGNYEPRNCEWVLRDIQANNTRRSLQRITFQGKTQPLQRWAEDTGIKYATLYNRISGGMPPEEALTKPLRTWPGSVR